MINGGKTQSSGVSGRVGGAAQAVQNGRPSQWPSEEKQMFKGMELTNLAQELKRQLESKKDLKAPTTCLEVSVDHDDDVVSSRANNKLSLLVADKGQFHMTSHFHDQVGTWAGIPSKYYDRMVQEAPELLASNLNHWLHHTMEEKSGAPQTRLVRLMDDQARAFLSNRYRTIDNWDIAEVSLPVMMDSKCEILSSNVDYNKMFIKAATPKLTHEVKKGDVVQMGVVVSNSEVGQGSVKIEPFIYRLACLNGMVIPDAGLRRFHVGRFADELEAAQDVFRDETRLADDKAFMMKVRDVLLASFQENRFQAIVDQMAASTTQLIAKPITKVIEEVTQRYRLSESVADSVLTHLAAGGDITRWGFVNAVTRSAEDQATYEQATALERLGGELLTLDQKEWNGLAA
jgi:hypothetical protein